MQTSLLKANLAITFRESTKYPGELLILSNSFTNNYSNLSGISDKLNRAKPAKSEFSNYRQLIEMNFRMDLELHCFFINLISIQKHGCENSGRNWKTFTIVSENQRVKGFGKNHYDF